MTEKDLIAVELEADEGSVIAYFPRWCLPAATDSINFPDWQYVDLESRSLTVLRRIYKTRRRESDGKIEFASLSLLCDFDDPLGQGFEPISYLDPSPPPNPHLFAIHEEYIEAVLCRLEQLAKEAIAKSDWSDVFRFLIRELPNHRR